MVCLVEENSSFEPRLRITPSTTVVNPANTRTEGRGLTLEALTGERGLAPVFSALDLRIQDGELIQIVGANGSGKSTLLRIIAGLMDPESGSVHWQAEDIHGAGRALFQADCFYLGHKNAVAEDLTAIENLEYFLKVRGVKGKCRCGEALEAVAYSASLRAIAGKTSAGQKQRIALAKLLLVDVKVWLLDEPFTSLDAQGKSIVENLLYQHCRSGGIALVATHQSINIDPQYMRQITLT